MRWWKVNVPLTWPRRDVDLKVKVEPTAMAAAEAAHDPRPTVDAGCGVWLRRRAADYDRQARDLQRTSATEATIATYRLMAAELRRCATELDQT